MDSVLDRIAGKLVLADGSRFDGYMIGASNGPVWGEIVFNTSMTGYQEVITDPSYAGQIIMMTYPQIGNYGITQGDSERVTCAARALVVRELSTFFSPGPNRIALETFMIEQGLPGLCGIDTRAVTLRIRSRGAVIAAIGHADIDDRELVSLAQEKSFSRGEGLVESVSGGLEGGAGSAQGRAAVIDLGVKKSIVENVQKLGVAVEIFDAGFKASDLIDADFDFVVLSNGPGDPTDIPDVVEEVGKLLGNVPVLGICLGHQIAALAIGADTYKLKFGHHGANQPVVHAETGRVYITAQNHGYAVTDDLAAKTGVTVTYTNANDGTVEGFVDENRRLECVQFHPEAAPGPHDTAFIFSEFHSRVKGWRDATSG